MSMTPDQMLQSALKFNTHFLSVSTGLSTCLLMHGTAHKSLAAILAKGLAPRSVGNRKTNWPQNPSNKSAVYLTSSYPLHYANLACEVSKTALGAILEVSLAGIQKDLLSGDEDAYALSKVQGCEFMTEWPLKNKVKYWAAHLESTDAEVSLRVLGNCTYRGTIPASAVTKVRLVTAQERATMTYQISDPVISPSNFKLLGGMNQRLGSWLMGNETDLNEWFDSKVKLSLPVMSLEEAAAYTPS